MPETASSSSSSKFLSAVRSHGEKIDSIFDSILDSIVNWILNSVFDWRTRAPEPEVLVAQTALAKLLKTDEGRHSHDLSDDHKAGPDRYPRLVKAVDFWQDYQIPQTTGLPGFYPWPVVFHAHPGHD